MKRLFTVVALAALLGAGGAAADHHADKSAMAKKAKKDRVCKMVKIPGNRTKTKLCKPQAFWDEQKQAEKAARR